MPEEHQLAPDFTLLDADSQPVKLSSFRGRNVVLFFYGEDDTPVCTREACSLRDGVTTLAAKNAVVIGISPDSPASHRKFIDKYHLGYTLLSDPTKAVMTEWGCWGKKLMYGREVTGVLRHTFVLGSDGIIKKIVLKVRNDDAANQALQFL